MSDAVIDAHATPPLLRGETVVFTGTLWSWGRKEARLLVDALGGVCDEEVTLRTTLLVAGAGTYPQGTPDLALLTDDSGPHNQKLRRVAVINAEHAGRIRVQSEDQFCRAIGRPPVAERRGQLYGQKDILAMYPALREDHLRYLQKWGFIQLAFRNHLDTWLGFADLTTLRQVHAELLRGSTFRAVLRDMQASRTGQLAFDFRLDAQPARIIALKPRPTPPSAAIVSGATLALPVSRPLSDAETHFLEGSALDDGSVVQMAAAAQAYRRALDDDPDLVAALINLANIRYSRDELAEARALYERAIGLDAGYFEAHFNLGNIHHDHGHFTDAEACYRAALALNPGYAEAHFYLAVTLEKMGRSVDARRHWTSYQQLAPHGEWVELAREFSD